MKIGLQLLVACLAAASSAGAMDTVRVSPDQHGFVLIPSGIRFTPWGHNYAAQGLEDSTPQSWEKIDRDLSDLAKMRANVIRIHLQFPQFMEEPGKPKDEQLTRLKRLLQMSERHGIYLDITGLACYRKDQRARWYDALSDKDRWAVQQLFWEAVAQTCAKSPAVFCYDLINEPIVSGTRKDGWYAGEFGGYEFLQRLSLDQHDRPLDDISRQWTGLMVRAIRKHDKEHLITIGMLPAWGVSQQAVGPQLDFIAVHIYPNAGKVKEALADVKRFDVGKPIVIEETFPLSCSAAEERQFLLDSRGLAAGWIGQYPSESVAELNQLKRSGKLTVQQAFYTQWLDLFQEVGPQMFQERPPDRTSNLIRRAAFHEFSL